MLVRMSECEGKCEPNRSFDFEPLAMSVIGMQPDAYDFVQAKQSFENARQKIVPDGWEEYVESTKDDDHIKIWRRYDPASGLYLYKLIGTLRNVTLEDFRGVVNDLEYRGFWDVYTHSLSCVQKMESTPIDITQEEGEKSAEGDLVQWRVKFNFPFISDREYLFVRHVHEIDGVVIFLDKQANDELSPPKKSVTRVANYNNAICLLQEGDDVIMGQDYITALDLRMSLPNWLINWAAGAGVKGMIGLYRDAIKKYPGWKDDQANPDAKKKKK